MPSLQQAEVRISQAKSLRSKLADCEDLDAFVSRLLADGNVTLPGGSRTQVGAVLLNALEQSVNILSNQSLTTHRTCQCLVKVPCVIKYKYALQNTIQFLLILIGKWPRIDATSTDKKRIYFANYGSSSRQRLDT